MDNRCTLKFSVNNPNLNRLSISVSFIDTLSGSLEVISFGVNIIKRMWCDKHSLLPTSQRVITKYLTTVVCTNMILIDMTNLYCGNVKCKVYELQCYHAFNSLINTEDFISEAKLWTLAALRRVLNHSQTYFCSQSWWLHWQIWWHLIMVAWAKGFSYCITSLFVAWAWELFPLTALQDQLCHSQLTLFHTAVILCFFSIRPLLSV